MPHHHTPQAPASPSIAATPATPSSRAHERSLWFALTITGLYLVAEIVGGVITNSLALLSDAAHMFTDVAALSIAVAAVRIARRPADDRRTFGYRRLEVLAAAFNAGMLFAAAMYIVVEAIRRFANPPEVQSVGMLVVAVIGLLVNIASMLILRAGSKESLNMKGAYLEVMADMLGSLGVIAAAIFIKFTGYTIADPIVSVGIGLFVLPRSWKLLSESVNVLLEGVPAGVTLDKIRAEIAALPGVKGVHDLHVWSVTTGANTLSVHVVTDAAAAANHALAAAIPSRVREIALRHGIVHATVQTETKADHQAESAF